MIYYEVPLETYPNTYNKKPRMNIALAAQKNYNSLYLMRVYSDQALINELKTGFEDAGLRLRMGKSCIQFKKLSDLPLDVIKNIISKVSIDGYISFYEKSREK